MPVSRRTSAGWKPRRIRPLMVPCDYVVIPAPLDQLDTEALKQAVRAHDQNPWITLRARVLIATRVVRGKQRPVAALSDRDGHRVWVQVDPEDEGFYDRLWALRHRRISMYGRVYRQGAHWFIETPEPMPTRWFGRPRPVYSLHHKTRESLARETERTLRQSCLADAKLQNEFRRSVRDRKTFKRYLKASNKELFETGLKDKPSIYVATGKRTRSAAEKIVEASLRAVHEPATADELETHRSRVQRIAAVCMVAPLVKKGLKQREKRVRKLAGAQTPRIEISAQGMAETVRHASRTLPFELTEDQSTAAAEILTDLASGQPMRRVLSGDVGTGKTAVYATAVIAMLDAGYRAGIMLPSAILALQVAEKFREFAPDTKLSVIAGSTRIVEPDAPLWVGTVGLQASCDTGFDIFIADEQHRFSKNQREATVGEAAHQLEVTATCIPRTQALLDAGLMDISRLRLGHVDKTLNTRIWEVDERTELFHAIQAEADAGGAIIVVYPGKEVQPDSPNRVYGVKEFGPVWQGHFPGQVAICHGDLDSGENQAQVRSVAAGDKRILVGTSVLEVGIDVPGVRRVVIVQPDRFGLSTLHQLRGRAGRDGGQAHCDLLLVSDISDKARKRLEYLCEQQDGFRLAEYDMDERGAGDATSEGHRQSGALPKSPFSGYTPPQRLVSDIAAELNTAYAEGVPTTASKSAVKEATAPTE